MGKEEVIGESQKRVGIVRNGKRREGKRKDEKQESEKGRKDQDNSYEEKFFQHKDVCNCASSAARLEPAPRNYD